MPKIIGNELWFEEIRRVMRENGNAIHWREAEILVFMDLVKQQQKAGYKMSQIVQNLHKNYGIKQGSFYKRLRKAGFYGPI